MGKLCKPINCRAEVHCAAINAFHPGKSDTFSGTLLNKGKALSMAGSSQESQQTFWKAWKAAWEIAPGVWLKVCAALKQISDEDLQLMEEAVSSLGESGSTFFLITPAPRSPKLEGCRDRLRYVVGPLYSLSVLSRIAIRLVVRSPHCP